MHFFLGALRVNHWFHWLQHEYMSYMEKKTTKRQTTIITLSDHNKQEINNIQLQKEIMEEEFDEKEKGECLPSEHTVWGHYQYTRETPFKWGLACRSIVARF